MNNLITIVSNPPAPWEREVKGCVCGARFPHPSRTKQERRALSLHKNDCTAYQRARREMISAHEEDVSRTKTESLVFALSYDDTFTREQARRLVEIFGE